MAVQISELGADATGWDRSRGRASACHLLPPQRLAGRDRARAFNHRTHYLVATQDGALVGVLPLAQVKTRLFGHTLISLPFCVYGGPLAAESAVARSLAMHAAELGRAVGCRGHRAAPARGA